MVTWRGLHDYNILEYSSSSSLYGVLDLLDMAYWMEVVLVLNVDQSIIYDVSADVDTAYSSKSGNVRLMIDDPSITIEEYIKLQAEKAQRRGRTFNWQTTTYGKIYCDDHDFFTNFEADYPDIVYDDALTLNENVSPEPTVSIYNAIKTDFHFSISFSDFDDEDYTFICDKDSFSYKLILVDDLKLEPVNDHVIINTELCSENIDIKPMDNVVCISYDTTIEFDKNIETIQDDMTPLPPRAQRGLAPKKVTATDLFYLRIMDQGVANVLYLLVQYLFRHTEGRKSGARMSGRYFIGRLAEHFGLVSDEGKLGLSVISRVLPVIDLDEIAEGAPNVDEGAHAIPSPIQAPQLPLAAALTRTMAQRLSRLEEEVHNLRGDMDRIGVRYMTYADTHVPYQRRRVRQRTREVCTSVTPLDKDQSDP
ncbi:hypothetical protein Tco_0764495 [Tanacetum coccineum]